MIGSAQSAQLVNCVILTCHTACHAPPDVTILRMHISSESLFPPFPKRLALRMGLRVKIRRAMRGNGQTLLGRGKKSLNQQRSVKVLGNSPCFFVDVGIVFVQKIIPVTF